MPTFLFTGTNGNGRAVTDRVEAATLSAARFKLELHGFKDLVFHTDDLTARLDGALETELPGLTENPLNPQQELEARRGGGVLRELWFAWKVNSIFWVPLFAWSGIAVWQGRPYGWLDTTGFALSLGFVLYFLWVALPGAAYQKLLEASVYFRWADVRRWAKLIRFLKRIGWVPIPEFELDFRVAFGLATEGKLEQALLLVNKYEEHPVGKFQYFSRLSSIFEAAGEYGKMTECRRLAAEHGTGKPEEKLDLALGLVQRERKPAEARAILQEIDPADSGELVQIFLAYCHGLVAVETNDWDAAETHLRAAIELSRPYQNNVLVAGMIKEILAYLSLVLAQKGEFARAKSLLHQAEPLLRLRREDALLERCRTALGLEPQASRTAR